MILVAFLIFMLAILTFAAWVEERRGYDAQEEFLDFCERWDRSWGPRQ